jgi:hypothetical protein
MGTKTEMRVRVFMLPLSMFVMAVCACGPAAELVPVYVERTPVELAGGYSLGRPALGGLHLYGKAYPCYDDPSATCYPTIVEQSVVKIGWDDRYILVERHPLNPVIFATPDATNPSWFVVVLSSGRVHEHLSYAEFTGLIESLGIADIDMQDAMEVYRQKR